LSRPRLCRGADIAKVPLITARDPPLCVALRSPAMLGGDIPNWAFWAVTGRRVTVVSCCRPGIAGIVIVMPVPVLLLYCAG
jgi:hypothetical protein